MKTLQRNILLTLMIAILGIASVQAGDKKAPAITLAERSHSFGIIHENGGPVSYEFKFKNTGDAPLVIISANASCGCTRPSYPQAPIKPGKTGTIKVTYLPKGRPGEFNKTVKVRTNDPHHKRVNLKISGNVVPASK